MGAILVIMFVLFVALGVPISFALGVVSFTGIASLAQIPNTVVFSKMFNGLNSFTLLAVPLFILAANLMNEGEITEKLIDCCNALVGHFRGGLAYSNVLVSMIFAGISGSSQADTAGVGKIFIPAMEKQGYDKGTSVGVTAASSTLGSIIPPSITMVVYAGIANVSTGALFMSGLVPGILLGLAMMTVVKLYSKKKNFPQCERVSARDAMKLVWQSMPALLTPIILIGGIVSGLFTPTESAAFASMYALLVGLFFYRTIKVKNLPRILIETMKMSSLSLFALATANALGISPIILGLIIVVTLALGLVTPPYGLCLLIASSISGITIEDAFKGTLPYFLSSIVVLMLLVLFPMAWLAIPAMLFPGLF